MRGRTIERESDCRYGRDGVEGRDFCNDDERDGTETDGECTAERIDESFLFSMDEVTDATKVMTGTLDRIL